MASLTVRGLDQDILSEVLATSDEAPASGLGGRIHARFAALDGLELDLPGRTELPTPAEF
jgi:hypothetical protein